MSSLEAATTADTPRRRRAAKRSRTRTSAALGLASVIAIATLSTGCTPELTAEQAVNKYWGHNTECAMRIVKRESGYQATAQNSASSARGLFQIMPSHMDWIGPELGYTWDDMLNPEKNAHAAKKLSEKAYSYWQDGWQPWRIGGAKIPGGGCPA